MSAAEKATLEAAKGSFDRAREIAETEPLKSIAISIASAGQATVAAILLDLEDE